MCVIYIIEPGLYYQWKELKQAIPTIPNTSNSYSSNHKYTHLVLLHPLFDSLVVEYWHRVPEVPGSIPSQGRRHTKDVIKMVPVVPLFRTEQ